MLDQLQNKSDTTQPTMHSDLAKSGLIPEDIRARELGDAERQTTGTPQSVTGYVIPYFDIQGRILKFYRVKLLGGLGGYRQVANFGNHIYFPPNFHKVLRENPTCIMLTEGEKKAAAGCRAGVATCAVSGVDSWRNRIVTLPKGSELAQGKFGAVVAKLPGGKESDEKLGSLAEGLTELVNFVIQHKIPIVIAYDANPGKTQTYEVQAAAAQLGYELRYRGVPLDLIRNLVLDAPKSVWTDKVGLDDFLESRSSGMGLDGFKEQLKACLASHTCFPIHPNPREFVNKKLQSGKLDRRTMQMLSTAVLSDLDSKGMRLRSPDDDSQYYFSRIQKELTKVDFKLNDNFAKTPFGVKLYKDYNLSAADFRMLQWLGSQFSGEEPIVDVRPRRVMTIDTKAHQGLGLFYQLSGSEMVHVTPAKMEFLDNGQRDILFDSAAVEPCKVDKLQGEIRDLKAKYEGKPLPNYWYTTIKEAKIAESKEDRDRKILSLLYSISPWFYRWEGTQLPVEMTCGEPGSGKSSLYILRLNIIDGKPKLRNAPADLNNWSVSVGDAGALHVTDNVHMVNNHLRQELSDEMCRIITEPNPSIEKRKLYSDNELVTIPVTCVFAITALKQPFNNADIIARSIITEMDKGTEDTEYDVKWDVRQLQRNGGREGWQAQQLVFVQRMFQKISREWNHNYKAKFRLINIEQLLIFAAEIYGWDGSWIPEHLESVRNDKIASGDKTIEGLLSFIDYWQENWPTRPFSAKDVAAWAEDDNDYKDWHTLTNSRTLGKYLKTNANKVAVVAHIYEHDTRANATRYIYKEPVEKK